GYARLRQQSATRWADWHLAEISSLAGDYEDEASRLRIVCEWLETVRQPGQLVEYLGRLGRPLCMLGRFDEAEQCAKQAQSLEETIGWVALPANRWRQVLARGHAYRG